jgi:putative DNA primase/helicase
MDNGHGAHQAAREAYKRGWHVIPLREGDKRPNLPIGHPFLTTAPSRDEYASFEFGNYGVVCGELSGIVVLDIDGEKGYRALRDRDIEPDHFETPAVVTPNGVHYYFKYNPKVQTGVHVLGKGTHVDIRSDGSYVVGPGSTVDGVAYRWLENLSPEEQPLDDPPDFMFEHKRALKLNVSDEDNPYMLADKIGEGSRNLTLLSVGGLLVKYRSIPFPVMKGTLQYLNENFMESPLPDSEVETIAKNAERYRENDYNGIYGAR